MKSPFMDYCKKIGAKGNMFNFCNGVNVQRIRDEYWKPIEEQDPDHLKWIGRSAYWKGFDVLFDLYKSTKGTDLLYTLEGMEKSIQFVDIRKTFDFQTDQNNPSAGLDNPCIDARLPNLEDSKVSKSV